MDIIVLLIFAVVAVIVLILHSYFKRGFVLTFNFFLFAFMLTFIKGGVHIFKFENLSLEFGHIAILHAAISAFIWMLVFYLSWCLAEKIVGRVGYLKDKIFPTLLYAGIVIAAFAYAIELIAVNIGWWGSPDINRGILLTSFGHIRQCFYFSIYFLAAYFLIAYSKYKKKDWKIIFFILPFIHSWLPLLFGRGLIEFIEEALVLIILFIMVFISPLRFDYSGIKMAALPRFLKPKLLDSLPMLVLLFILSILVFLNVAWLHNLKLLISLLPIGFLVLLAIRKIPFSWIFFFTVICFLLLGKQAIPLAVPVIFLIPFQLTINYSILKNKSLFK